MSELVFPLAALTVVFAVIVPASTVVAVATLRWRRRRVASLAAHGTSLTLAMICAPVAAPLVALTSALTADLLSSAEGTACVLDHLGTGVCHDDIVLLSSCLGLIVGATVWNLRRACPYDAGEELPPDSVQARRLALLQASHPRLANCRVLVRDGAHAPMYAAGLFAPAVSVDRAFMDTVDDAALLAALLHEADHLRQRDALRLLFVRVCLTLNPLAALLKPELSHWRQSRESACDEASVADGGHPLDLAAALIRAARAGAGSTACCVGLTGAAGRSLEARLTMLMLRAQRTDQRGRHVASVGARASYSGLAEWAWLPLMLVCAALIPVAAPGNALAMLHTAVEFCYLASGTLS